MKLLFYRFMIRLCWFLEDIYECVYDNNFNNKFYPSKMWEDKMIDEEGKYK